MRRLQLTLLLSFALIAVTAPSASAAVLVKTVKWHTWESNTTKTYVFDQTPSLCGAGNPAPSFRLTMQVRLGQVRSTSAVISSIKFTWTNFRNGNPNGIWNTKTRIEANNIIREAAPENPPQNYEGGTFTATFGQTYSFNTDALIYITHIDKWPVGGDGFCEYNSYIKATFSSAAPPS